MNKTFAASTLKAKMILAFLILTLHFSVANAQEATASTSYKDQTEAAISAAQRLVSGRNYKEAFDLLRQTDQATAANRTLTKQQRSSLRYLTSKERMRMYIKMRREESAKQQLAIMEGHASNAADEDVNNDLLYSKAVFFYTFGKTTEGNAIFNEMVGKMTKTTDFGKVDEVYKTLIATGRRSGNVSFLSQSYDSYIAWKQAADSIKVAEEKGKLQQQIDSHEATIAEKDSSLATRQFIIIGLCIVLVIIIAILIVGGMLLLRYIMLTRRQKSNIQLLNDSNALKAQFISKISEQLEPTLMKFDRNLPEVKALLDFTSHVKTLSSIENSINEDVETEEVQVPQFCNALMDEIRQNAGNGLTLTVNASNSTARLNREMVSHILLHLLNNAIQYTPAGGTITLEFKKRSPHTFQFIVTDTGKGIDEEKRENVFKPFAEIHDLTKGDGLGLPICMQMARKMKGDLSIDPQFKKGTRFVLELHS